MTLRAHRFRGLTLVLFVGTWAPTEALAGPQQLFHVDVLDPPSVVATADGWRLAYELHLSSFSRRPLLLRRLTVACRRPQRILTELDEASLRSAMASVAHRADHPLTITPGRRAVVYLDFALKGPEACSVLSHAMTVQPQDGEGPTAKIVGGVTEIARRPVPRLGPPLRGGPWAAIYDPGMKRGHRRVFYATEGRAVLPGRFAVDFMRVDEAGRLTTSDGNDPTQYIGYGAPVLAVADGVIIQLRDDVRNPRRSRRPRLGIADASGNYIALDIGGGSIAFYEHLKQGAPVKLGQRVRAGDVVGYLGFTGTASVPHLHFHVADRDSVLGGEGRPFVFGRYRRLGHYSSIQAFIRNQPWLRLARARSVDGLFPVPNAVIEF